MVASIPGEMVYCCCTVYDGAYHTPLGRFSMLAIFSTAKKRWALEAFRRERSEGVSFGIDTLSVVDQSSLGNRPRGG